MIGKNILFFNKYAERLLYIILFLAILRTRDYNISFYSAEQDSILHICVILCEKKLSHTYLSCVKFGN